MNMCLAISKSVLFSKKSSVVYFEMCYGGEGHIWNLFG